MIIDVSQPVLDYKGKPAKDAEGDPVLVRNLIFQALNTPYQGDQRDDENAYRKFKLTTAVFAADDDDGHCMVKLSQKDLTFILEQSGKVNPVLAHGRLRDVLDPPDNDEDDDTPPPDPDPAPDDGADIPPE